MSRTSQRRVAWMLSVLFALLSACASGPPGPTADSPPAIGNRRDFLLFQSGDPTAARPQPVRAGVLLVGGGTWPPEALRWWFGQAGHGHVVVLRASYGGEQGREMVERIGGVASATTVVFRSRRAASDPQVLSLLAKADAIFISGGDQANYIRFWSGTPLQQALNRHVAAGKPIGGTSAGLAILGRYAYGALDGGSLDSETALAQPAGPQLTIVENFLQVPPLYSAGALTDTHFSKRNRQGRLIALMARVQSTHPGAPLVGVAVDEEAVLAIDERGEGRVFGAPTDHAWLFYPGSATVVNGQALEAGRWRIVGIGPGSTLHARPGAPWQVQAPFYEGEATVHAGRLTISPAWPGTQQETMQ